jgi:predicted alpha/beta superfamily hydrolase
MQRVLTATLLTLVLTSSHLPAAEPVVIGQIETFPSKILGEERSLMIHLPDGYEASTADYPVLVLLDARTRFHHTTGTLSALARTGHVPEMIVVGIINTDRTRDLTPPWTNVDSAPEEEGRAQVIAAGGGADHFLRFIREELMPHIEKKYRAAPFRILVGHSFGGLFAVHAFVTDPDLFAATLAISPSLWWDEGKSVEQAKSLFEAQPDLTGHLYLTLADEGGDMVEQFRNMQTLLRYQAPKGLMWQAKVLDGEDHASIPMPSVYSSLRFFFPRWQTPGFLIDDGLVAIDKHYASLSQDYGYKIETPETMVNNLGYRFLGMQEYEKAIEIFQTNIDRHPLSTNVYDSLGEAMEAAGRPNEARALYQRAYESAKETNDPNLATYKAHFEAASEKN